MNRPSPPAGSIRKRFLIADFCLDTSFFAMLVTSYFYAIDPDLLSNGSALVAVIVLYLFRTALTWGIILSATNQIEKFLKSPRSSWTIENIIQTNMRLRDLKGNYTTVKVIMWSCLFPLLSLCIYFVVSNRIELPYHFESLTVGITLTCAAGAYPFCRLLSELTTAPWVGFLSGEIQEAGLQYRGELQSIYSAVVVIALAVVVSTVSWTSALLQSWYTRNLTLQTEQEVQALIAQHQTKLLNLSDDPINAVRKYPYLIFINEADIAASEDLRPLSQLFFNRLHANGRRTQFATQSAADNLTMSDVRFQSLNIRRLGKVAVAGELAPGKLVIWVTPFKQGELGYLELSLILTVFGLVLMWLGTAIFFIFSRLRPIVIFRQFCEESMESGGLTRLNLLPIFEPDEIGMLMKAFNKILIDLRQVTARAKQVESGDFETEVPGQSDLAQHFRTMIGELRRFNEETKREAGEINAFGDMIHQAVEIEQTRNSNQLVKLKQASSLVADLSHQVGEVANAASRIQTSASDNITTINDLMIRAEQLTQVASRIQGIVSKIRFVSRQSRVLSMNASVEAARAGGSGRSVAVLAEQARALNEAIVESINVVESEAKSIRETAKEFIDSVKINRNNVHRTGELAESVESITQDQLKLANRTVTEIGQIGNMVSETAAHTHEFQDMAIELNRHSDNLMKLFQELRSPSRTVKSLSPAKDGRDQ